MKQPDPQQRSEILDGLPRSPESDCGYFADRLSATRYFFTDETLSPAMIDLFLENGFRRCGDLWYLNECPGCQQCIPYRLDPAAFLPSRNMKRVLRRNADVEVTIAEPEITADKIQLYLNYQHDQHYLKPVNTKLVEDDFSPTKSLDTMAYQMYDNPESTMELTMTLDDRLIGFGTLDVGETSVSLVYFAFDPDEGSRSLGTLNILKTIEWARDKDFATVYLGLYIDGHRKMNYKSRFGPAEIMTSDGRWVPFEDGAGD